MTVPIFLGWLGWLQLVHVVAGVALWRRRATLSTRIKAALLSWGGLAFWYWLPAPIYSVLTMNLDELQLAWTALTFFWEVPVVGGAFVLAAQRLYPAARPSRPDRDPARAYREVMRYPTLVAALLFVFTLAGYALGTLQLRVFAALPPIEQAKNVSHGIVISLLLAVFYYLALDRMLEPARTRIAREAGVGAMVVAHGGRPDPRRDPRRGDQRLRAHQPVRAPGVPGHGPRERDHDASPAISPSWPRRPMPPTSSAPCPAGASAASCGCCARARSCRAADFAPATRALVAGQRVGGRARLAGRPEGRRRGRGAAPGRPPGRRDLPHRRLWPVAERRTAPGPRRRLVLVVTVGMLVFASRASTQAVRALSSAVRRVEAGQVDATVLRLETGDEIGELSAVVERYVRQSRDLRENLEEKVRDKTRRLQTLQHIDRSILAAESAEAIARGALPRLRSIVPCRWGAVLLFEPRHRRGARHGHDGEGGPREGARSLPLTARLPAGEPSCRRAAGGGWRADRRAVHRAQPAGRLRRATTPRSWARWPTSSRWRFTRRGCARRSIASSSGCRRVVEHLPEGVLLLERDGRIALANPFARAHLAAVATLSPAGDVTDVGGLSLARLLAAPGIEPVRDRGGRRARVPGRDPAARRRPGRRRGDPRRHARARGAEGRAAAGAPGRGRASWPPASRTTSTTS